jgi:hypothetical protein
MLWVQPGTFLCGIKKIVIVLGWGKTRMDDEKESKIEKKKKNSKGISSLFFVRKTKETGLLGDSTYTYTPALLLQQIPERTRPISLSSSPHQCAHPNTPTVSRQNSPLPSPPSDPTQSKKAPTRVSGSAAGG